MVKMSKGAKEAARRMAAARLEEAKKTEDEPKGKKDDEDPCALGAVPVLSGQKSRLDDIQKFIVRSPKILVVILTVLREICPVPDGFEAVNSQSIYCSAGKAMLFILQPQIYMYISNLCLQFRADWPGSLGVDN